MNGNGESKSVIMLSEKLNGVDGIPNNFFVESGQDIDLDTNIYKVSCTPDSPQKLYQYCVNISPNPRNPQTSASLICSILFPDGGPVHANAEWNSLVYLDQQNLIISTNDNLAKDSQISEQGNAYQIKITLTKEISPINDSSDLAQIANTTIGLCFTALGFSSLDDSFINNTDYKDVDHLRLVGGYLPKLKYFSKDLCLYLDTATRTDRKGTLYDFLISGVSNVQRRSALEESLQKMTYVTRHLDHQKTVKISRVRWNSKASTEKLNSECTVADFFLSNYNFVAKPDDPIIEISKACPFTSSTSNSPRDDINKDRENDKESGKNENNESSANEEEIELVPASALSQIGITDTERSDSRLMASVRDSLFLNPADRKQKLDSLILSFKNDDNAISLLNKFGLTIGNSVKLTGFVLDPPEMIARSRSPQHQFMKLRSNDQMVFDVSNIACAIPPRINAPPLIIAPDHITSQVKEQFLPRFMRIVNSIDMSMNYPEMRFISTFTQGSLKNEIYEYIRKNGTPSFIIVFNNDKSLQKYDSLKQLLISNLGIPSQFILADTIFGRRIGVDDILLNIAFQICAKTGGVPFYVPIPIQKTMVLGIAGYSNQTNSSDDVSYCLSASIDNTCARFYSDTLVARKGEVLKEIDILQFLKRAKKKFTEMVQNEPSGLIVYRLVDDEDELANVAINEIQIYKQFAQTLKLETKKNNPLPTVKSENIQQNNENTDKNDEKNNKNDENEKNSNSSLESEQNNGADLNNNNTIPINNTDNNINASETNNILDNLNKPSFVFFAVQKSQTVRLFAQNDEKIENPPPGTIAFNSLSANGLADFYLVSNHTQYGTAMPVRYTILANSSGSIWTDEKLAKLTYYLSFNYANFPGAMRLPAPLTAAIKIATFSQQHMNFKPPSATMIQKTVNFV
ncbi:hypothetical protein TRFO_14395 [Tritrichomonas foetus]|uniref:Piwi domain-containing protein n=1 Tax=Tritrichomonas foetus TaxID=1144522 RepID=A0A1J4KWD9_9EUKA|nr:hypothetical protein TRFO_14395 [Tritrichomonas foetus]|eukprot:OHT15200.1 hypothetical protein TRFO_14395 [Tritrichomonas foetus]